MAKKNKKIMFLADTHCGNRVGLTPPDMNPKHDQYSVYREKLWNQFTEWVKDAGKQDILVCLGDMVDGQAKRSRFGEIILPDPEDQARAAAKCIDAVGAKKNFLVRGTPYHARYDQLSVEDMIRMYTKIDDITDRGYFKVHNTVFRCRHKVGASTVPYGRSTMLRKEAVWNKLNYARGMEVKVDVFIHGHVHYFEYAGDYDTLSMTLPALQGIGSEFGKLACSGSVDFGFVVFVVRENGYTWKPYTTAIIDNGDLSMKV